MKNDRDTALQRAAESVADGVPFAWEQESEGQGEVKEKLRRLQVLQNIAEVHRATDVSEEILKREVSLT